MDRRGRLPAPGTVIGALALFVALGTGAYAATEIPKNSVGSEELKFGAVQTKNIKNGAVSGRKIKDDSVGGNKIKENSLGQVPYASHADTAGYANNAAAADSAQSATDAINADSADSAGEVPYVQPFKIRLANDGDSETIASNGPISLVAVCGTSGGNPRVRIVAETTDTQTTMDGSTNDYFGPTAGGFMPPAGTEDERTMVQLGGPNPTDTSVNNWIDSGFLTAGDGTGQMLAIGGEPTMLGVNYLGARCVALGVVNVIG